MFDIIRLQKIKDIIESQKLKNKSDTKVEYDQLIENLLRETQFNDVDDKLVIESLMELSFEQVEEKEVLKKVVDEIGETIADLEEELLDDRLKYYKESIKMK